MYEKIFQSIRQAGNDNAAPTRRRYARRANDICVLSIGENIYPVHDWSQCGVLFEADGRQFEAGTDIEATLKFRDNGTVTDIPLMAKVIRTGKNRVAFEFKNLSQLVEDTFARIIQNANEAAMSAEFA